MRIVMKIAIFVLGAGACAPTGPKPSAPPGVEVDSITVTSHSFASNATIPIEYTCDGKDISPQLTWSAPPEGTRSLAFVLEDPDASGSEFTHWLVFNIPPEITSIPEAADAAATHGTFGTNSFPDVGYRGPCPPHGESHRYMFRVYAVNTVLKLHEGATRGALNAALSGHLLGLGTLVGTFGH
jgi:Raf kinase inhibitor-like YbhB/YbcL family protein